MVKENGTVVYAAISYTDTFFYQFLMIVILIAH